MGWCTYRLHQSVIVMQLGHKSGNLTCIFKCDTMGSMREKYHDMKPIHWHCQRLISQRYRAGGHLCLELLVVIGGEGGAAVLRDVHLVHYVCHPLPQLVTLLSGQQPVQNHVSVLHVLWEERRVLLGRFSQSRCFVLVLKYHNLYAQKFKFIFIFTDLGPIQAQVWSIYTLSM